MHGLARHATTLPLTDDRPLLGRRILVADDEALIAIDLEMTLSDAGAEVLGPCLHMRHALVQAWSMGLDAAVLDVSMTSRGTVGLIDVLAARGIPAVLHTGCVDPGQMLRLHPRLGYCPKPSQPERVVESLARALRA